MIKSRKAEELLREQQFVRISILLYIPLGFLLMICLIILSQQVPQDHRFFRSLVQSSVFLTVPVCAWLVWYLLHIRNIGLLTFGYILSSGYVLSVGILFIWGMLIAEPQARKVAEEAPLPTYRSQQAR